MVTLRRHMNSTYEKLGIGLLDSLGFDLSEIGK